MESAAETHRLLNWLDANDRIRGNHPAAQRIATQYGRNWRVGRNTAICAASMNTPLWQRAVAEAPTLFA